MLASLQNALATAESLIPGGTERHPAAVRKPVLRPAQYAAIRPRLVTAAVTCLYQIAQQLRAIAVAAVMSSTLSPMGLITDAVIGTIVQQVNSALGTTANPVLTASDGSDGISFALAVPGEPVVALDNLTAGAGGVGGRLHIDDIPPGGLSASLFGDFTVALTAFDLTLAQGAFVATNIAGALTIPFFTSVDSSGNNTSQTVDVEVAVRANGSLAVTLAAQQSDQGKMTPDGLVSLHYSLPVGSSIDLEIATLEVDLDKSDGVWRLTLTGSLTLGTDGIQWPEVELRGLSIDSAGHVTLQGGWIDLPRHAAIDFYGFHVALQRLGFGSDSTGRWIGFDADVNLIEGMTLGGTVRGLQVNIDTGAVSLSGVSVDFEIPGVLSFSGEIDHASIASQADLTAAGLPSSFPLPAQVFAGGVDLIIEAAGDLEIDAQFIVAQVPIPIPTQGVPASPGTPTQTCFFLALDVELPGRHPSVRRRRAVRAVRHVRDQPAPQHRHRDLVGLVQVPDGQRRYAGYQRCPRPAGRQRRSGLHGHRRVQVAESGHRRVRARRRGGHRHHGRRLHRVGVDRFHDHLSRSGADFHRQGEHPLQAHQRACRGGQLRGDGHLRRPRGHV